MFTEFTNQVWTPSLPSVTITDNTDYSVDGISSKKVVWSSAQDETCTITFDAVTLSNYEEISLHIHQRALLSSGDVFKITVGGVDFVFGKLQRAGWNHILLDCSSMPATSSIVITSLVNDLILFIDYIGYRRVTHNRDIDLIQSIQDAITLDYGVSTTLTANAAIGATSISLASSNYINDTSSLLLDDGLGVTETVYLASKSGKLKSPLTHAFLSGNAVTVLCPVLLEDHDNMDPDPICGIMVYDKLTDKRTVEIPVRGKVKQKHFTGALGVIIYIDCRSKKKVLQLAREFDHKYGERFGILLDGEQVDLLIKESKFIDDTIGNNPRISYYYEIEPQPYLIASGNPITALTVTAQSLGAELVFDTEVRT